MFIISNQRTTRVTAQRGLSCSRQSEKYCNTPILTLVGRTVHWQNIVLHRQDEIHHGEHAFFDFSSVSRASHNDDFSAKIDGTYIALSASVNGGIRFETRRADDMPIGFCNPPLLVVQSDEHVVHK